MKRSVVGAAVVAALSGAAFGQESFSLGTLSANVGAANTTNVLAGTDASFNSVGGYMLTRIRLTGSLTEINGTTGDFISENRMHVWGPNAIAGATATSTLAGTGSGFAGTVAYSSVVYLSTPVNPAGLWNYRMFNSVDDSPAGLADAELANAMVEFNFSIVAPNCINLGNIGPGTFNVNTEGSTGITDTEIALFRSDGFLIGQDDDSGTGNLSSFNAGSLAAGTYYVAVGAFNSTFGNAFAATSASASTGSYNVNVTNGTDTLSGTGSLAAAEVHWYCFTVPTPGSLALLGLGGLAAARRRR